MPLPPPAARGPSVCRPAERLPPPAPLSPHIPFKPPTCRSYGSQVIPVDSGREPLLKYEPEKGCWLLGFLPASEVPRWLFMGSCKLMMPDASAPGSEDALSALVQAAAARGVVGLIRLRERVNTQLSVCALTPWPGSPTRPDCFVLNQLPYEEDLRCARRGLRGGGLGTALDSC